MQLSIVLIHLSFDSPSPNFKVFFAESFWAHLKLKNLQKRDGLLCQFPVMLRRREKEYI